MPKLSQIVYLADLISADRDYKDVKKMRKYAEQSLEKAMFEALKFSIKDSVERVILSLFPHLKHIMILPIIQNKGDFMDNISQNEKLSTIVKALDSKRAEDIRIIEIGDLTIVADYFVIAMVLQALRQRPLRRKLSSNEPAWH